MLVTYHGYEALPIKNAITLKSIVEETIKTFDNFKSMGADVKAELL